MLRENQNDPVALGLAVLAATLGEERRAQRFLDLTGIGTDELRARAADPALLAALLRFLEAHEPDLLAVAEAIGAKPEDLVQARRELEEGSP
ncbi:MAG: DUF3572 family protein [Sphingomicrobium sp.]